jgi:group I intron endonuclease
MILDNKLLEILFPYCVYAITREAGQRCVGKSENLRPRWNRHRVALRTGTHWNAHLQAAWNLYGELAFSFVVLERFVTEEEMNEAEKRYIREDRAQGRSYNIADGGDGGATRTGVPCSEETKAKISAANKGQQPTEYCKQRSREAIRSRPSPNIGRKASDETRAKLSVAHMGKSPWNKGVAATDATRRRIREARAKQVIPRSTIIAMHAARGRKLQ